jgi:hypothetical protein
MMRISRICGSWMKQFRGYRFQVMAKAISVVELHYLHKFIITFPKLPICKCKHLLRRDAHGKSFALTTFVTRWKVCDTV